MQAIAQYPVSGEVLNVDNDFSNVVVQLKESNITASVKLLPNGTFSSSLKWNKTYYFTFIKKGYVSKVIEFSTLIPQGLNTSTIEPYFMPVRLFKTFDGVDTVFFEKPVAKIRFNKAKQRSNGELGDFEHDMDYSLQVKYRIDKMREKGEQQKDNAKNKVTSTTSAKTTPEKKTSSNVTIDSANKEETIEKDAVASIEELNGAPALKDSYPDGETIEEFVLSNRIIHRHVFMHKEYRRVFLSVQHDWGGNFYFIDEAPIGYRCISQEMFTSSIKKYRHKIKSHK